MRVFSLQSFEAPTPPRGLSTEAKRWWSRLAEEYAIKDQAGVLLLNTAMEAFDRMKGAQRAVKRDGLVVFDRWGQAKAHPLLTVERDARSQMMAALKALNLDIEPLRGGADRPGGR